ncbi:aspartic peptidase domain-containing protein [Podospora didyma]|uniref:Probable aspartic-type endopeptidase OPSB n=1 Tax=Podospora didyma TaxID=330526 RepID=A0AAE0U7B9_9PEZI|nr:aspartic peptidase domain-containing protein [Podospora didyma]
MKGSATVAVASILAGWVRAKGQNGVVQWDIQKRVLPQDLLKVRKRASTYEEAITNEEARGGYFATCRLGTPGQDLTLQLDTGSSDIWVPDSNAEVCRQTGSGQCTFGTFNPDKSTTFEVVNNDFNISYVDGSSSTGDYFTDHFEIGGANLRNMTMGLGLNTDIAYGLVGVGYALNEAIVGTESTASVYPNLPVNMMDQGLINTVAYSLWLNDLDASKGSILFGGIDTEKYVGDLTSIKVYPTQGHYTSFLVAFTSLDAYSSSGHDTLTSTSFPIPVVLDSGTTLSYLPADLARQIWKEVGAVYSQQYELAVIPCSMQYSKGYFSFGFAGPNGPRINVTMDELVLDLTSGEAPKFTSGSFKGQDACEFGIQAFSNSGPFLLGDTFLRSAYVVYDLVNNEIGIAPTDFNSTKTNVVAFASDGARIPSATTAPGQNQATDKPKATTPAYAASAGFSDGIATNSAASGVPTALGIAQLVILGISISLTMLGSGIFMLL